MLALLLCTLLNLFIFIVLGLLISRFYKYEIDTFDQIFLGLVAANTLASALSLFSPINLQVLLGITAFCTLAAVMIPKEPRKSVMHIILRNKTIIFISFPFILISFFVSLAPQNIYDSGLYHIQAIKWIQEYPVVPGLANLHARFGFNSNAFSLNALVSPAHTGGQGIYSLNFTIYFILIIFYIRRLFSLYNGEGFTNYFLLYLIIFYNILRLYPQLSSPTPDFIAISGTFYVFSRAIELAKKEKSKQFHPYIPILLIAVYLVTVKLSTIPLLTLFLLLLISHRSLKKSFLVTISLSGLILLPWLARNIILTGYLLFPFPLVDLFNFDWQVPISQTEIVADQIKGWARWPGQNHLLSANMAIQEWFPLWWDLLVTERKLLFGASMILPLGFLIRNALSSHKTNLMLNWITLTSFVGVCFWFSMAPDFRFGRSFIIIAILCPLLFLPFKLMFKNFLFSFIVSIVLIQYFRMTFLNNENFLLGLIENPKYQVTPKPANMQYDTLYMQDIKVFIPINDERCFDHNLPCADPYMSLGKVELREDSIESGFKVKLHSDGKPDQRRKK